MFEPRLGEVTGNAGGANGAFRKQQSCLLPHGISVGEGAGMAIATTFESIRGQQAWASALWGLGAGTGAACITARQSEVGAPHASRVATTRPAMYFFAIAEPLLQASDHRLCDEHHRTS